MQAQVDDFGEIAIYCSSDDLCNKCKNAGRCPLIQAIKQEIVILHYSDFKIEECGLYERRK